MEVLLYHRVFLLISLFATFIFTNTHGKDKQKSFGAEMDEFDFHSFRCEPLPRFTNISKRLTESIKFVIAVP